jgi:hypothetical protein
MTILVNFHFPNVGEFTVEFRTPVVGESINANEVFDITHYRKNYSFGSDMKLRFQENDFTKFL